MSFNIVDMNNWDRFSYYNHFINNVNCNFSITANLDITPLKKYCSKNKIKLFPTLVFLLSKVINTNTEFRYSLNDKKELGYFDVMHPCYTVFQDDTKTFTNIYTDFSFDFKKFYFNMIDDIEKYKNVKKLNGKPNCPINVFPVSCIPWVSFSGFNLNIFSAGEYLTPITTFGKFFEDDEKILIPTSIQVHHAVNDGYHASKLINQIQENINNYMDWIIF